MRRLEHRDLARVDAAGVNNTWLGDIVASFLERHPEVQLEMLCTGRNVDLVEERFDVGIRAGALADSSLIARSLGAVTSLFVATPGYLRRRLRPRTPEDLLEHARLFFGAGSTTVTVRLDDTQVAVPAHLLVSDMDVLHAAARAGVGIARLPASRCVDDLRAGRFEQVLRAWSAPRTPVHVVYPSAHHVSAKVRAFVDHVQRAMTPPPWE